MISTGSGSGSTTSTSRRHTVFCPMKPIMGGLVQIKSDTFVALIRGQPNTDSTDLQISTADPKQSSQICPMLNKSSFHEWSKGLDTKFTKEKGDLFSFQHKLLHHFQDTGMDTVTCLRDLEHPTKMVNLLTDHTCFTQAYVKTAIKAQYQLYNSWMIIVPVMPCLTALAYPLRSTPISRIMPPMSSAFELSGCRSSRPCKVTHLNVLKQ